MIIKVGDLVYVAYENYLVELFSTPTKTLIKLKNNDLLLVLQKDQISAFSDDGFQYTCYYPRMGIRIKMTNRYNAVRSCGLHLAA